MRLRHVYLLLFVVGTVVPLMQFWPWFVANGLDISLFFNELFSTQIGGFFGLDVMISAMVLITFATIETMSLKMKNAGSVLSAVVVATLLVGVSSGFPLFLYLRQKQLDGV